MQKTGNRILIIVLIILIGCMLYIPGVNKLGLYRDAWNYFYNLTVRGPEMLIRAFEADRPADGYLIAFLYRLFGTDINGYLIWDICCRILSSAFFALTLLTVWPRRTGSACLAGLLAVIFPGFLQQVDGIVYVPHQTAMLCFMLSLWLTSLILTKSDSGAAALLWQIPLTIAAIVLSFCSMMLMEYYIGMEIYRFALIFLILKRQKQKNCVKVFFSSLLSYLPYLIPAAAFVYWRTVIFTPERAGTDVFSEIINPFLTHPVHEIGNLGVRILKNAWKLFVGIWTIPPYTLLNGLEMKEFIKDLIPAALITAVSLLFFFLIFRSGKDDKAADTDGWTAEWILAGLIGGTIALIPLIVSGRDIAFSASLDRFAWPGMIGAILFLTGILGCLKDRLPNVILTVLVVFVSVFVQWENQSRYIDIWDSTLDFWQQLIWRVPSFFKGTTIVTGGLALAEEDYEVFGPASMIYYPDVTDWAPVSAEILNEGTIRDIQMGEKVYRNIREIYTEKDYQQLVVISKPDNDSCLRIIDGENPVYSARDNSRIMEIGRYSRWDQIITDPVDRAAYPFFLPEEQEHNWCYYYESMELAVQKGDFETAAGYADEAAELKLRAKNNAELIPVIDAYVGTGRIDDALTAAEKLAREDYLLFSARNYFRSKDDPEKYGAVLDLLDGFAGSD